jgi:uncharacterized protein YwqG
MAPRASIEFVETASPIREPVTKFGGQPVWLAEPQWPLSRQTGQPMRFIGQIALDADLFGDTPGRMAYLFMTELDDDANFVEGTWEADGGENAVIVQPGEPLVPVENRAEGPALFRMVPQPGQELLVSQPCEFAAQLTRADDPDFVTDEDRAEWDEAADEKYTEALAGNKVGGTPGFLASDEFPGEEYHTLLLQLDATGVPFYVNFGDGGIGYAFLSDDGRTAKFLWQCC